MQKAFQQTISLMESERYNDALIACNNLIKSGFNHPQIIMIQAIALSKTNDFLASQNIFNQLINSFPKNAELYYNYALILQENNKEHEAMNNYEFCLTLNKNHLSALNNLGVLKLLFNQADDAKFHFERALKLQPKNFEYSRNLANACFHLKQYSQSINILIAIVNSKYVEESDLILLIDSFYKNNDLIQARKYYQKGLLEFKNNFDILNLASLIEIDSKKYKQALLFTKQAINLNPNNLELQMNQITAESHVKFNHSIIIKKLKKLCGNNPQNVNVFEFSAKLCESFSDIKSAKKFLQNGYLVEKNNTNLLLVKAKLFSRKKKYSKSIKVLQKALTLSSTTQSKIDITYELAKTYDKIRKHKKAWQSILVANRLNQTLLVHNKVDNQFITDINALIKDFKNNHNSKTHDHHDLQSKNSPNLVFIVGFPRSGTTLIERILQAHPQVKVLEETNAINELFLQIDQLSGPSYFNKLNNLTHAQIQQLRKTYIDGISEYTNWSSHNTIVDKMPMNGTQLALIQKIFPNAKIIFVERHPIDVCLSCLMQNMLQVFSMASAANVYNMYMQLIYDYKEKINFNMYNIKYENLISDMQKETEKLLHFLNLDWKDEIKDFHQNKSLVNTPSYEQVSQPIYKKSKYRYKYYLKYILNDIKPLKKWLRHFDYTK